jgi:hypothetical protein
MMKKRRFLPIAAIAAVALVAAACGGGGDDDAMVDDGGDMTTPPAPTAQPVDVTATVTLGEAEAAALLLVLPASGTSDTLTIAAGETGTRNGVNFTCMSAYPCTVTVTNSLGTILAEVSTQKLPDADDPTVMAAVPPPPPEPVDTFAELNDGSTGSIRTLVTAPTLQDTELTGMGLGGMGVADASMAALRSSFDPNSATAGGTAGGPGEANGLTGGSTLGDDPADPISGGDIDSAPANWAMKTLFRDWGDTAGDGDGGFETGAIVVKNLGEGTPYPFDRKLSGKYVNDAAKAMFALAIRADGTAPGVTTLGTSVSINARDAAAASVQWANMVFDSDSLVPAQSQDLNVNAGETFTGSYFDAPGQFQCIAGGPTDETCALARNDDGTVGVNNISTMAGMTDSTGRWSFTPDPGAMITVPDQDWMAYGAWLTTPDDAAGDHRLGVFFNGMDPWAPAADSLTANNAAGLRGSATYSGGATGVYVDGTESGLFTARAMLTAVFDGDMDGADDVNDDYRISGRIDNFRGTDGVFLGDDTQASPNDPDAGKDNDWVVELGAAAFDTANSEGTIAETGTTGSADGVSWTGGWNGQLFGPSGTEAKPLAPSGVAGRFWAETADADSPEDGDGMPVTAVLGAFGATKDD